jgi:hypothetical protein
MARRAPVRGDGLTPPDHLPREPDDSGILSDPSDRLCSRYPVPNEKPAGFATGGAMSLIHISGARVEPVSLAGLLIGLALMDTVEAERRSFSCRGYLSEPSHRIWSWLASVLSSELCQAPSPSRLPYFP